MSLATWKPSTSNRPCPVCAEPDGCLAVGDEAEPLAAICTRRESAKEVGIGAWLHRLRSDGPSWPAWLRSARTAAKRIEKQRKEGDSDGKTETAS